MGRWEAAEVGDPGRQRRDIQGDCRTVAWVRGLLAHARLMGRYARVRDQDAGCGESRLRSEGVSLSEGRADANRNRGQVNRLNSSSRSSWDSCFIGLLMGPRAARRIVRSNPVSSEAQRP